MSRLQTARRIEYWMPLAEEVAERVRAMPYYAWVRLKWFWTPDGLAAFEPEIVTPGADPTDWKNVVLAGEWITQFDDYRAEQIEDDEAEDDGEPDEPAARPHANIYTEDYR